MENTLALLNASIIYEIVRALGLPQNRLTQGMIQLAFGRATLRFSELALGMDREIGHNGPAAGVRWLLRHFVRSHEARGVALIPRDGPLLIASNHPASYDGLVIAAHVPRSDLKIIIGEVAPYQYLPNISKNAIFSPPVKNTFGRMKTVRNAIRHLQQGGALLIFPRGNIEPDPAFMPEPDAEYGQWSPSLEIFLRSVPQTRVLVTAVSGVISPRAFHHPITWFRKSRADRQRLAFIYQTICQVLSQKDLFGLQARVTFGELLTPTNHGNILAEIEQAAKRTLATHLCRVSSL